MHNGNGRQHSRTESRWLWLVGTVLFIGVFLFYVINKARFSFVDEIDVFEGGAMAWRGGDVYVGMMSQHMPFSYYFAIIPAMLGAVTIDQYRLGMYAMLALLWVGNWLHNRKHLPQVMLLSMPFLYLGQLNLVTMGTVMISDHWQGIGMAILLEEMLRYDKCGRISLSSAAWISLAIVLSFGCAFVAAYGVAAVCLCVCAMQLSRYLRAPKADRTELGRTMLMEDARLVAVCVAPFAVLLIWYAATGNLTNFFNYAYTINTDVYSKYMGGYGSDPGGTFFWMFGEFFNEVGWVIPELLRQTTIPGLLMSIDQLLRMAAVFGLALAMIFRKRFLMGVSVVLVTILSCPRGATRDSYHAMAMYCLATVCMGWWLAWAVQRRRRRGGRLLCAAAVLCAGLVVAPVAQDAVHMPSVWGILTGPVHSLAAQCINETAQPDDRIQSLSMGDCDIPVMTRLSLGPASGAATTPWTYEFLDAGAKQLEDIRSNHPRYVLYQPDMVVWGYETDVYAADTVNYVKENYTNLCWNLYVPNDEYEAIWRELTAKGFLLGILGDSTGRAMSLGEEMTSGETIRQTLKVRGGLCAGIEVYLANFDGTNPAGITVTLTDLKDGQVVSSAHMAPEEIYDNHYLIAPCGAELKAGGLYEIAVTADDVGARTRLVPYYTDQACTDQVRATVRGERTDCCLAVQLRYLPEFALADRLR